MTVGELIRILKFSDNNTVTTKKKKKIEMVLEETLESFWKI